MPGCVGRQGSRAHRVASEKAGGLGVKAEYETDGDGVQAFLCLYSVTIYMVLIP